MDDPFGIGTLYPVGIDMAHDIVTHLFFPRDRNIIVNLLRKLFKLADLRIGNRQALLLFRLCQCNPKLAPCFELVIRGENILHLLACITGAKWAFILIVSHVWFNILSLCFWAALSVSSI